MNIGIFTYGTRGDVQPYIALSLGLAAKGHKITIAAPENFKDLVEGYGIEFHPLHGDAEGFMNSAEGQKIVATGNAISLMRFFYKVLQDIRHPLRQSYLEAAAKVDFIIANLATLPITSAIAEKQNKKMALTYFMPPAVPTGEFAMAGLDFINFSGYNKLTYKLAHYFYWKIVKNETNEFRSELGLEPLKENLITYMDRQKLPDLYCFSPMLIPRPVDWGSNHIITGFLTLPEQNQQNKNNTAEPTALDKWLAEGPKPVYIGFGSNGVSEKIKIADALREILSKTDERILFCTGWAVYSYLPQHPRLFVTKYVNHNSVLPLCKLGVFHGGAGTLAAMLRHDLPLILVSFYTDQPTWGRIISRRGLGVHIPAKKLTPKKLVAAIAAVQQNGVKQAVVEAGLKIRDENGVGNAVRVLEAYFSRATNWTTL